MLLDDTDNQNLLDPQDPDDVAAVQEALSARAAGKSDKGLGHTMALLAISVFLFWTLQSASTGQTAGWIAALVLVLAVHEGGHFLAMRAFGFTDLKVFFIPFFGAAASGRKADATATQQAVVSLMGPLPGIVFALVAAFFAPFDSEFFANVVVLALFINAFNLLPVQPLDGGRFLHWTLFVRWPSTRPIVRFLNGAVLAALGWYLDAWILLGLGAIIVLGSLTARIFNDGAAELQAKLEADEERSTVVPDRLVPLAMDVANRRFYSKLTRPALPKTYANTITSLWGAVHRPASLSMGRTVALLAAYGGSVILVFGALVVLGLVES